MKPILSILVPTVSVRAGQREALIAKLEAQAAGKPVEILSLSDNRQRSIGLKRQALLDVARGKYIAFCDDDDDVSGDYIASLLEAAEFDPDVITFEQQCIWNERTFRAVFKAGYQDERLDQQEVVKRAPWHVNAWRRELVAECRFPDQNWGEDLAWSIQARRRIRHASHIGRVLHYYTHTDAASLAS